MIVDKESPYLLNLLPSVYEPNGFMHSLDANKSYKDLNEASNEGSNEDSNKTLNRGPNDEQDDECCLLKEKLLKISNLTTSKRMEELTVEYYNLVNRLQKQFWQFYRAW